MIQLARVEAEPRLPGGGQPRADVDIVLIGYNGRKWLPDCLKSLAAQTGGKWRLIFVDNGGNGNTVSFSHLPFSTVFLTTPRPMGFAEANNYALQQEGVHSKAVCFLNQDTIGETGWLEDCVDCLRKNPEIGAVSPLLRTYDSSGWDPGFSACAEASPQLVEAMAAGEGYCDFYEVPQVTAAAMVIRGDVLLKVGPFDPIYGSYYEDYDLCLRIRRAGYRIGVCGKATVCHYSGSSTNTDEARLRRMQQIIRNRAILQIREAGRSRFPAVLRHFLSVLPRNVFRGILCTPSSQPVGVQLAAYWQLFRLIPRLISDKADQAAWCHELEQIDWFRSSTSALPPGQLAVHQADCFL